MKIVPEKVSERLLKIAPAQLVYLLHDPEMRQNLRALLHYCLLLLGVTLALTVGFHLIMLYVEGQRHSLLTGFYWTIVTMSTLGYGDIVFESELGRLFSLVVLTSGIVMLLIVLPFTIIRYLIAPWLEAQIRLQAPRELPAGTRGHVLITAHDPIVRGLSDRLKLHGIAHYLIEHEPATAAHMHAAGIPVITGDLDSRATFEAARVHEARMVIANASDTANTNTTLTVREAEPDLPVVAIAEKEDSVDILELSGATHVLPLKRWLGEQLANRVNALCAQTHVIGSYRDLKIAELSVHGTPLAGRTIRETRLREITGLSVIGVWERGRFVEAHADRSLSEHSVLVVIGTDPQLRLEDAILSGFDVNPNPVVVIGGGKVGRSAMRALKAKGIPVAIVERNPELARKIGSVPDKLIIGDAADRTRLTEAGIDQTPSVLLTTNDDAMNIYLAVYCRRLNPELRIVSRITHERNVEALFRAGADFVLSYASLGARAIMSILMGRELVVLGEGVDLFHVELPRALVGKTLADSGIGARTGLNVIAIRTGDRTVTAPPASTSLEAGSELLMIGSQQQRERFAKAFS